MSSESRYPQITRRRFLTLTGAAVASAGLSPLLAACGTPAAPASPTGAPAKAAAPTQPPAKEGAIQLKLSHHDPPTSGFGKGFQAYADAVNQKSGGKLFITVYPSETLSKVADAYTNVINGVADIAWVPNSYMKGMVPLSEGFSLPMLGFKDSPHAGRVAREWWKASQAVQKEWAEVKVVQTFSTAVQTLSTAKKEITRLEDAQGLKIQIPGGFVLTEFSKAIGANPVVMAPPELYEGLRKGVVDSYILTWQARIGFKLTEVTKYVMNQVIYAPFTVLAMNKKKWESLPPDLQAILEDPGLQPNFAEYLGKIFDDMEPAGKAELEKNGGKVITLPPAEQAKWTAAGKKVWDLWISNEQGKGFDPKKELDQLLAIVEKTK